MDRCGCTNSPSVGGLKHLINTNYYYDGDKLITEVTPYHRNAYLYDENGQVYGYIQDNNTKYFYVKDFMQNILGIIDTSGNLVVRYNYDAYGN